MFFELLSEEGKVIEGIRVTQKEKLSFHAEPKYVSKSHGDEFSESAYILAQELLYPLIDQYFT